MTEIGHKVLKDGNCRFTVWAPLARRVNLQLTGSKTRLYPMTRQLKGYWQTTAIARPGDHYYYLLDGNQKPDPASFWQPEGVFGPSAIVDTPSLMPRPDDWKPPPLDRWIIYELHTGTFSPQGTFEGIIEKLGYIKSLGINAIELMPISQFSGDRNWGYDGVFPFAVHNSYGGPFQLAKLVAAAHKQKIAVILDVVYNHLGPEGSCLADFAPYFTAKYLSSWGQAINFDQEYSDQVRNYWIQNALFWFSRYQVDALRLDAVHGIFDFSALHFLAQLSTAVKKYRTISGRTCWLIAESDLNDSRIIRESPEGGYGIDSQWNDDFHHSLHALLTGESKGYYADFGRLSHFKKALEKSYVYDGCYSIYRKRRHGNSTQSLEGAKFISFIQNHDQVGNRLAGKRLASLVNFEALKLAAALSLFSPYIPLLFMGEEYGENRPFRYFTSHQDPRLGRAVKQGRREEFASFAQEGAAYDPQSPKTFTASKLDWSKLKDSRYSTILSFYRTLISLRQKNEALGCISRSRFTVTIEEEKKIMVMIRQGEDSSWLILASFNPETISFRLDLQPDEYKMVLSSSDTRWLGPGSCVDNIIIPPRDITLNGRSFNLYKRK